MSDNTSIARATTVIAFCTAAASIYFPLARTDYSNVLGASSSHLMGGFTSNATPTYAEFAFIFLLVVLLIAFVTSESGEGTPTGKVQYVSGVLYILGVVVVYGLIATLGSASNSDSSLSSAPKLGFYLLVVTAILFLVAGYLQSSASQQ